MSADWSTRCLLARVRVLALREQVLAGGDAAAWQLTRAIDPILGDLLPLPREADPDPAARPRHLDAAEKWERLDASAGAAGGPVAIASTAAAETRARGGRARAATRLYLTELP